MIRRFFYFICPIIAVLVLGFVFVKSGHVTLVWEEFTYEVSLFVALCFLLVIFLCLYLIVYLGRTIFYMPKKMWQFWHHRLSDHALLCLKTFIAENFKSGAFSRDVQNLSPLLKKSDVQDIGEYLLGKSVTEQHSPLSLRVMCDKLIARGDWPRVLSVVKEVYHFPFFPSWAILAEIQAHLQQKNYDQALAICQSGTAKKGLSADHLGIICGAISLEKALVSEQSHLIKFMDTAPLFWPLAVYITRHNVEMQERYGAKLLYNSWEKCKHLAILTCFLDVYGAQQPVNVLLKEMKKWWIDEKKSIALFLEAYVLTYGLVWGQAKDLLQESLVLFPSQEGLLLQHKIYTHGFKDHDRAQSSLYRALSTPRLEKQCYVKEVLAPLRHCLPMGNQVMEKYMRPEESIKFEISMSPIPNALQNVGF